MCYCDANLRYEQKDNRTIHHKLLSSNLIKLIEMMFDKAQIQQNYILSVFLYSSFLIDLGGKAQQRRTYTWTSSPTTI